MKNNIMELLDYENEMLLDSFDDSRLFIFAKGISIHKVLQNLFRVYGTDCNLVFVLSASPAEESYFLNRNEKTRIFTITTEFNANDRKSMYASGGVFFITPRILVVDFLKEVVPADKITGIIIFRAHNVVESSQEAFILRLYRTKNKTGFIKCFSHSPTSFLLGFSRVTTVMRSSFLSKLSLWPRFHATIKDSLKNPQDTAADDAVIEIQLKLTEEMREIQSSLMDLVSSTLSELKRLVPALNDEDVSLDTALTKGFEKIIRAHVDPVWNTIDRKSKEILSDLKIFRLLLAQLTKSDCVTFYSTLFNYMSPEALLRTGSDWVLSKSAETMLTAARRRLKPLKKDKDASKKSTSSASATPPKNEPFDPESHPKWLAIGEILEEINKKLEERNLSEESESVCCLSKSKTIIFAEDFKTCSAIRDYLSKGRILTLAKIARNCENIKLDVPQDLLNQLNSIARNERGDPAIVGGSSHRSAGSDHHIVETNDSDAGKNEVQVTLTQIQRKYEGIEFLQSPVIVLPLQNYGDSEAYRIPEILEKLMPDNIIIFDPDLELIRNIEIHRARVGASQIVRIYFLVFRNSIEEQIYLTGISREKMAFEKLIEEKTSMIIPTEREGKDDLNQDLWRDPTKASQSGTGIGLSRRNMETVEQGQEIVLVDMREFRSELPSLIHKRGIDLEPLTLDVGDYILTPDICVERKSISDLIGSLNSGRLYKQAEAMVRHYKKPMLLIEQEQKLGSGRYKNDLAQVMPKLQLLTINFPKLRIIWSPGAHYTSEVFHEFKRGKDQPQASQALAIMKDEAGTHSTSRFNPIAHALISKLPGIDSRNVYAILNRVSTLDELCTLSLEDLTTILENKATASILYSGIHNNLVENVNKLNVTKVTSKHFKSKGFTK